MPNIDYTLPMPGSSRTVLYLCLLSQAIFAGADEVNRQRLPATLTLEYALSLADEPHPDLMLGQAAVQQAEAQQHAIEADDDLSAKIEARLGYVDPSPIAPDQGNDDNRVGLIVDKELYNFGLQAARSESARSRTQEQRYAFQGLRAQRELEIARRYFDVLLADLVFLRYNEEMAVEYIQLDRLRTRKELGKASDLQVIEQEQHYQRIRYLRTQSQNRQRSTRAVLAEVLNRPGQLPNELAEPKLDVLKRTLPEYEELLKLALENNMKLRSLREHLVATQKSVDAARAGDNPRLTGRLEAYDYSRQTGSSDSFRAGVTLEIPIYDGARNDSAVANARAGLYRAQARLQQAESEIRQAVLDTWLEIDNLRAQYQHVTAIRDYREMDLDYRRALYEMEVRADLGKGMALISDAQFLVRQTEYKLAAAWIRLDILTGQLKQNGSNNEKK